MELFQFLLFLTALLSRFPTSIQTALTHNPPEKLHDYCDDPNPVPECSQFNNTIRIAIVSASAPLPFGKGFRILWDCCVGGALLYGAEKFNNDTHKTILAGYKVNNIQVFEFWWIYLINYVKLLYFLVPIN